MKPPGLPATILTLLWAAQPAPGVDLAKLARTIAKEPAYQTKTPKYCLLVFGPEAQARMWLVLDGKILYVDRRGDGEAFPVMVGTPGLGKGTFTQVLFLEGGPNGVAEIVFPNRNPDAKPIVVKVVLQSPN